MPASAGDTRDEGSILGLGRSPGVRNGNPLKCSCLGNPMDRKACQAIIHGVAKSQTQLSMHAQSVDLFNSFYQKKERSISDHKAKLVMGVQILTTALK